MTRIERLLSATDFSPEAWRAADYAGALGQTLDVPLVLLHSRYVPAMAAYGTAVAPDYRTWLPEEDEVRTQLDQLAYNVHKTGVDVTTVILDGPPPKALAGFARPGDLLVVGTHARAGFERWLFGSTAERIVRHVCCPTIVVPPECHRQGIAQVLIGTDMSPASIHALHVANDFAGRVGAKLRALHVVHAERLPYEEHFEVPEYLPGMIEAARTDLQRALADLPNIEPVLRTGIPYRELLDEAESTGVDLIALGLHGHNPIEAAMLGSTANRVLRRTHCPVMVTR